MAQVNHDIPFFTQLLRQVFTRPIKIVHAAPVGGGDIHHCYQIVLADDSHFFIKCNHARYANLLEQEHYALAALKQAGAIKVPAILGTGECEGYCYLVLEWLELSTSGDETALGRQLAQMHQHNSDRFGWAADNFIGHNAQQNAWCESWATFWREQRLLPQLMMALKNSRGRMLSKYVDDFIAASDALLEHHNPTPALLHGDLWGGNKAYLASGEPVIFDPASYYGDPETDIAFTRLFGGFGADFYTSYNYARSLLAGASTEEAIAAAQASNLPEQVVQRQVLYNIYHQLNHFNLFGEGYLSDCEQAISNVIKFTR